MEFSEKLFDFGCAPLTFIYSHRFYVKNKGREKLIIKKVRPDCGCSTAPVEKSVIPPGDSAAIDFIFDSFGFEGKVKKKVYIHSNTGIDWIGIEINLTDKPEIPLKFDKVIIAKTSKVKKDTLLNIKNLTEKRIRIKVIAIDKSVVKKVYPCSLEILPGKRKKLSIKIKGKKKRNYGCITLEAEQEKKKWRFTVPVALIKEG